MYTGRLEVSFVESGPPSTFMGVTLESSGRPFPAEPCSHFPFRLKDIVTFYCARWGWEVHMNPEALDLEPELEAAASAQSG